MHKAKERKKKRDKLKKAKMANNKSQKKSIQLDQINLGI